MPLSATSTRSRTARIVRGLAAHPHRHPALVRELQRIGHQVHQHLAQPPRIAPHDRRHVGVDRARQLQPLGLRALGQEVEAVLDRRRQIELDGFQLEPARLDLREVQDVVDQGEQRLAGLAHRLRVLALLRRQRRVEQQPRHADHPVHRRPDLVAHRRQELALRPARRLRRIPRLPQLLLRALVRRDVAVRRHEAAPPHGVVLDLEHTAVGQRQLDPAGLELARLGHPLRDLHRRVARAVLAALRDRCGGTPRGAAPPMRSRA